MILENPVLVFFVYIDWHTFSAFL